MADFPALPLWTDAYLADTRHLKCAEHGAYLLLLIEAWRRRDCALPDDDEFLAKLVCATAEEWMQLKPIVMAFWKRDGRSKTWRQKRLTFERSVANVRSKSQRDISIKGWKTRKKRYAGAMPPQPQPQPHPLPYSSSSSTYVDKAARARKKNSLKESSFSVLYSEAELRGLAFKFDGLNLPQAILELEAWCDNRGINDPIKRKNAIYGALKRKDAEAKAADTLAAESPPPSRELLNSKLVRKHKPRGKPNGHAAST